MESLRKTFFAAAMVLALFALLVELGSTFLPDVEVSASDFKKVAGDRPDLRESLEQISDAELKKLQDQSPPGLAIPAMALLDGLVLFTMGLIGMPLFLTHRVHGRIQGVLTLIVSLLVILGGIGLALWTFTKLLVMVALFTAAPFGTIAYMAIWGFFNRPGAAAILGLLMILKLGFGVCLVLAHQRFLQNKGLVLILLTSILANLVVSFLHGLAPVFLVSITDAAGALIAIILALIWAIIFLIGSIFGIVKAVA